MIRLLWLKKVSLKETSGKLVQLCREWSNESEACQEKKKSGEFENRRRSILHDDRISQPNTL